MRAQFILSEIGIGLRRNVTLTLAVILTVAISFGLAGSGWLLRQQVETMKDFFYAKVEVSVFLCSANSGAANCAGKDVTQQQREEIQDDLNKNPLVEDVIYESKDQAYQRFKKQFKDSPDLVKNVSADALPESFRVKLKDPNKADVVASAFAERPGVEEVQDIKKLFKPIFDILGGLRSAAYVIGGVMLLAAVILISNTIRVAAFSRRRETGIMRLVGASNLYIQLPFLLEGAIAGLVGGLAAVGLMSLGKWFVVDRLLRPRVRFTPFIGWDTVLGAAPFVVVMSVLLSALVSFITLRRFLRV